MKTRYKILIITLVSFIVLSFFFPQVFLIFHLDKYETSEKCDSVNGVWDWYDNACDFDGEPNQCENMGGIPACFSTNLSGGEWNLWYPVGNFMCRSACVFEDPNTPKINVSRMPDTVIIADDTCGVGSISKDGMCVIIDTEVFFENYIHDDDSAEPNPKKELTDIVFNSHKLFELGWMVYPGGAGYMPPTNSTLSLMYKDVDFGVPPLDFEKMLDDKIFVDKCESNNGIWNYTYHDCHIDYYVSCEDIGGIFIGRSISDCTGNGVCLDRSIYLNTCVFEYDGE